MEPNVNLNVMFPSFVQANSSMQDVSKSNEIASQITNTVTPIIMAPTPPQSDKPQDSLQKTFLKPSNKTNIRKQANPRRALKPSNLDTSRKENNHEPISPAKLNPSRARFGAFWSKTERAHLLSVADNMERLPGESEPDFWVRVAKALGNKRTANAYKGTYLKYYGTPVASYLAC